MSVDESIIPNRTASIQKNPILETYKRFLNFQKNLINPISSILTTDVS